MRGPSLQVVTSGPLPDSQMLRPDEPERNRFPCCIVWAPLPLITWLFPIVGHMGIADSRGVVHDFAGPYTINKDSFMVGKVRRVCRVGEAGRVTEWDQAIEEADQEYRDKMHNICCQNCHHHTAAALTRYGIPSTQFSALWMLLTQGRWVSPSAAVATFLPFVIIVTVIAVVAALSKTSQ